MIKKLTNSKILITGGAGFIGSNLIEYFLQNNNEVVCLDNLSTGHKKNIAEFMDNPNFQFLEGDIRHLDICKIAVRDCEYVFHEAALGSVPRSIKDPVTTNSVNIDGFLNVLTAARDEGVKQFIYAASSSTYGDSKALPKVEEDIGRPLSPYAITKVVNEYFAKVYSELYGLETIGLRYFNVFGKRQDPNGAYAAVIPLWVKSLLQHESPIINGDGSYSRDFTYIDNVIQANELAAITPSDLIRERLHKYFNGHAESDQKEKAEGLTLQPTFKNKKNGQENNTPPSDTNHPTHPLTHSLTQPIYEVFNIAYGQRTSLNELAQILKDNLAKFDTEIADVVFKYGETREGDVPHSLASIEKGNTILGYQPEYSVKKGLEVACGWYWENLK